MSLDLIGQFTTAMRAPGFRSVGLRILGSLGVVACIECNLCSRTLADEPAAEGMLAPEALMVLDLDGDGVRDVFETGRQGAACFVRDNIADGAGETGPDGFRDAALRCPTIPEVPFCPAELQCADLGFSVGPLVGSVRSGVNSGKLTIIYVADSDGRINVSDRVGTDDSYLYVGIDIFNGQAAVVPFGNPGLPGDPGDGLSFHNLDVIDTQTPGLCDDGVADFDHDGTPYFYGVPFDVDADGDPDDVTRWDIPLSSLPNDCHPGDHCAKQGTALTDTALEEYRLFLYACTNPSGGGVPGTCGQTFNELEGPGLATSCIGEIAIRALPSGNISVTGERDDAILCQAPSTIDPSWIETFPADLATTMSLIGNPLDVEFIIRHIDSVIDLHFPDKPYEEYDRYRIARAGVRTKSGSLADNNAEDDIEGAWFAALPQIEVKKQVRCLGEGDDAWRETAEALPGTTLEFRIEVENTGNVPLNVFLDDILEAFGLASVTTDAVFLDATFFRPSGGVGVPINVMTCGSATHPELNDLNCNFFFPGPFGFLAGVSAGPNAPVDARRRLLGTLQPVDVCGDPPHSGDRVRLTFRATVDAAGAFCDAPTAPVDVRNRITALGDPDPAIQPTPGVPIFVPAPQDGDEAQDVAGDVAHDSINGVDTPRELIQGFDDNVVTVDVLCAGIDLCKQVQLCDAGAPCPVAEASFSDCDDRLPLSANDDPAGFDIRYRYRLTNSGELDLAFTLTDLFLCQDLAIPADGVGFVPGECAICTGVPPGEAGVISGVLSAATTRDEVCRVQFRDPDGAGPLTAIDALQGFLTRDDNRPECRALRPDGTPDPECYKNCAHVDAEATHLDRTINEPFAGGNGLADTMAAAGDVQVVPPGTPVIPGGVIVAAGIDGILSTIPSGDDIIVGVCGTATDDDDSSATICNPDCEVEVRKRARCILRDRDPASDDCDDPALFGPFVEDDGVGPEELLAVAPGSCVQFEFDVTNTDATRPICRLRLTDALSGQPDDIAPDLASAELLVFSGACGTGSPVVCPLPGTFNVSGTPFELDLGCPGFPSGTLAPGQCLRVRFNATIPVTADPVADDPVNTIWVEGVAEPDEPDGPCDVFTCLATDTMGLDVVPFNPTVTKYVQCLDGCAGASTSPPVPTVDVVPGATTRYEIVIANNGDVRLPQICIADTLDAACASWLCDGPDANPDGTLADTFMATITGTNGTFDVTADMASFSVDGVRHCFEFANFAALPVARRFLAPGEMLSLSFDLNVPDEFNVVGTNPDCRNDAEVELFSGGPACPTDRTFAVNAQFDVLIPKVECDKTVCRGSNCCAADEATESCLLHLPCNTSFDPPLTLDYTITGTNTGEATLNDFTVCDAGLRNDAANAGDPGIEIGTCTIPPGPTGCVNFGQVPAGGVRTLTCRILFHSREAWEAFARQDALTLDPAPDDSEADRNVHVNVGSTSGTGVATAGCGTKSVTSPEPCRVRVQIDEPCLLDVRKRVRCIEDDGNAATDECNNPTEADFGAWHDISDPLDVTRGACVQYEIEVSNVADKSAICRLRFTDVLSQQPGNIAPYGQVEADVDGAPVVLPTCFQLPGFAQGVACELPTAGFPSGTFQPDETLRLRFKARVALTADAGGGAPSACCLQGDCIDGFDPHGCIVAGGEWHAGACGTFDCSAISDPDCPSDPPGPRNKVVVEGACVCAPPSYSCRGAACVDVDILRDGALCVSKRWAFVPDVAMPPAVGNPLDCAPGSGFGAFDDTDPALCLDNCNAVNGCNNTLDLQTAVFPVLLRLRIQAKNDGDVPLSITIDDPHLRADVEAVDDVSFVRPPECGPPEPPHCELGRTKIVAPGVTENWYAQVRVDSAAAMRALAARDTDEGDTDPLVYCDRASITASIGGGATGCVREGVVVTPRNTQCRARIIAPRCEIDVVKDVKCRTDPDGAYASSILAVPGSTETFRIQVTNLGTSNLLQVCLDDTLGCADWLVPDSTVATIGGDPVTNCLRDVFEAALASGERECYTFLACRPNAPWIAPGESLIITFNVRVPAGFNVVDGLSDTIPDCRNEIVAEGYSEICPDRPPPLDCSPATGGSCAPCDAGCDTCCDRDCADIEVDVADIECVKTASTDLNADGTFERDHVSGTLTIHDADEDQPLRVRWEYRVTNPSTSELSVQDICLVDEGLLPNPPAMLPPGVTVESCDLSRDDACEGTGNDGALTNGPLAPGASVEFRCQLRFDDLAAWRAFAATDDGDDACFENTATTTARPSVPATHCGPSVPITSAPCAVEVCLQPCIPCPPTKAKFDIWNENEVRFSGTERCLISWDQEWLSQYTAIGHANHFHIWALQTDKGKARIDGMRSPVVCGNRSNDLPLLGIAAMLIEFPDTRLETAGTSLVGAGTEAGRITYDLPSGGDELVLPPGGGDGQPPLWTPRAPSLAPNDDAPADDPNVATATVDPRVDVSTKGSLLVYSKVEIKWDSTGTLIQDTFIQLTNDNSDDIPVDVKLYFVNGDQPLSAVFAGDPPVPVEREHRGCSAIDNTISLTHDESAYWSALTGNPKGVSPFVELDAGFPPGRPDTDPRNPGGRVVRGYVLAWAVQHGSEEEIRWNHLLGSATIVNYRDTAAWTYPTWAFQALAEVDTGEMLLPPFGVLDLNGAEYEYAPNVLVFDFFAVGARLSSGAASSVTILDTDLTLWAVSKDLRQDCPPPR